MGGLLVIHIFSALVGIVRVEMAYCARLVGCSRFAPIPAKSLRRVDLGHLRAILGVVGILLRGLAIWLLLVLVRKVLILAVLRRIVSPVAWSSRWVGRILVVGICHFGNGDVERGNLG